MALDEQPPSIQFVPDSPPASSPDPYSSSASAIDFSQLPSGFSLPFLSGNKDRLEGNIQKMLKGRAADIQRPLTLDETKALAYQMAKVHATTSWSVPIGIIIGAWRFSATRENYGFPFVGGVKRQGGWFDGERIQIMGREVLKGFRAKSIVQLYRFSSHTIVASFVSALFAAFFGGFAVTLGNMSDPRLKDYYADLRAKFRRDAEEKWKQRITQRDPTRQGGKIVSDLWKERRDAMEGGKAKIAEGSPLAGRDEMEYAGDEGMVNGGDVGGAKSGAQIKLQETSQQPVATSSPWSNLDEAERQPIGSIEPEPDPSPSTESDWSREASDGGSAWERIRRGAGSQGGAAASGKKQRPGTGGRGAGGWQKQREQREGSSGGGNDFTFSSTEQERSYAQEEAQQDFDARVERERQGGDFSEGSGSGGGRRWG